MTDFLSARARFGWALQRVPTNGRLMARRVTDVTGRFLALLLMPLFLAACADGYVSFPIERQAERAIADEDVEIVILTSENIDAFSRPARGHRPSSFSAGRQWTYLVGPGDVLSVIVFNHPELTLPAGESRSAEESGFQVSSGGTFNYPYIGVVQAQGRTAEQIRGDISQRLREFIPDPQVDVRIVTYNAQSVVVSGEVGNPRRHVLTSVPMTLVDAINAAGGFTGVADQRAVTLQRGGQVHSVDVRGFLEGGLRQNNPVLRNGDVVSVPRRRAEEAFLLGEIANPDVINLANEPVTLTQAITRLGGLQQRRADARGVLVFRLNGDHLRVFQLDTSRPAGLMLGTRFVLEPGDVVYVLRSPLQRWNDTISRLLPSVRALNIGGGGTETD